MNLVMLRLKIFLPLVQVSSNSNSDFRHLASWIMTRSLARALFRIYIYILGKSKERAKGFISHIWPLVIVSNENYIKYTWNSGTSEQEGSNWGKTKLYVLYWGRVHDVFANIYYLKYNCKTIPDYVYIYLYVMTVHIIDSLLFYTKCMLFVPLL